ncbi:MAG: hypothetical protein K0S32_3533 [Bacteroidetes bacterium]|nr:hypothetical protein [Bacteroidota bacterium]
MKNTSLSYSRGTLTGTGASVLLGVFGIALITQIITPLWIIGLFGILMLTVAFCITGIEFNPTEKVYREYYQIIFLRFGKWLSYDDFKFVSVHGITLKSTYSMVRIPTDIGTEVWQTGKIILLNKTHTKKLFIVYSEDATKTKRIIDELSDSLEMEIVKFNPPKSQRRKK